jgi:hypothetical protein
MRGLLLLGLLLLGLVVLLVALRGRGKALFRIRIRGGRAELRGQVPGRSQADVLEFVDSLELPDGAEISGHPAARNQDPGRGFELRFSKIPQPTQQRIRNYLYL